MVLDGPLASTVAYLAQNASKLAKFVGNNSILTQSPNLNNSSLIAQSPNLNNSSLIAQSPNFNNSSLIAQSPT